MNRTLVVATCITMGGALSAHAAGWVETYAVNVQYRGTVKKGFADLGDGKVAYEPLEGRAFRVRARAEVRHPDDGRVYAFKLYESFEVTGDTVRSVAVERRQLNEHAKPHEEKITEVIPFAYLVRVLAPPPVQGDPSRTYDYRNTRYTLRYRHTERHVEVDLYRGDTFVGKFFLLRDGGRVARLDKFRIPIPEEHLVISFIVRDSQPLAAGPRSDR